MRAENLPSSWHLQEYQTVPSTMDMAEQIPIPKTVIWALTQTQGRGRHQRPWVSERGNLYCSFVIDPGVPPQRWGELSFVAALAVGETLQSYLSHKMIGFKWPNDVLVNQQKIAGILLQSHPHTSSVQSLLIIGIGINIALKPSHTSYPATCLQDWLSEPAAPLKQILFELMYSLEVWLKRWHIKGFKPLREKWLNQACFLHQPIRLQNHHLKESRDVQGIFQGIDDTGRLLLKMSNNVMKTYSTGDVFFPSAENL